MTELQLKNKNDNCDGEQEYLPKLQCLKDKTNHIETTPNLDSQNNNEPCLPDTIKTEPLTSAEYPDNVDLTEPENIEECLKIEIDDTEIILDPIIALEIEAEKTGKLKVNLEQLSLKNKDHKNAMENLPKFSVKLTRLDKRVLRKVNKFGFVKYSSDLLKPLKLVHQKQEYPNGRYFSRKKNVVFEGEKFDKKFFHLALRRKANVDDGGKFLKYQCPTCPYKSWSFRALSKHHIGLHGFRMKWTLTCPDCPYTCDGESVFKRHMQRHKKEPDLQCPHCPYITRFDVGLRTHLRRWHLSAKEAGTWQCSQCNFTSICKSVYEAHLRVHTKGTQYLGRFVHKSKNGTEGAVLKCEYCNFMTPNKNGLRTHMQQTHKIENPFERSAYRCTTCGFETKHQFSYRYHVLLHKSEDEVPLLECYNCDFKTKFKKYLTLHIRTDHRVKKDESKRAWYKCAECTKQYREKYHLKNHIFKQHRDTELLMCHQCNYTTKNMFTLRRHTLKNHIQAPKEKVYECQKCEKKSSDKAEHKAHLRTHKYICYICSAEYSSKELLRDHIVGHMSKKQQKLIVVMHKCTGCDYKTRRRPNYLRHLKRFNHYPEKSRKKTKIVKGPKVVEEIRNDSVDDKVMGEIRNDSVDNEVMEEIRNNSVDDKVMEEIRNDSVDDE